MAVRTKTREPFQSAHDTPERYRALLRSLPDLVFINRRDGTYVDLWAGTEQDLAVPRERIIGMNVRDVGFSDRELKDALAAMERALETGQTQSFEYSLKTMRGLGHFEARIVRLNRSEVLTTVRNITKRVEIEQQLRDASRQLEAEKQALQEKNIALEQVLKHLESRARDYQARVTLKIKREIRPVLKHLQKRLGAEGESELSRLQERLDAIPLHDFDAHSDRYASLSRRELQICDLLRRGHSSKEISEKLNLSLATIHKHREQIRNKLGFQGQRVNLAAYLRLHPAAD
jgi:PAS domain S-box-containing protein